MPYLPVMPTFLVRFAMSTARASCGVGRDGLPIQDLSRPDVFQGLVRLSFSLTEAVKEIFADFHPPCRAPSALLTAWPPLW